MSLSSRDPWTLGRINCVLCGFLLAGGSMLVTVYDVQAVERESSEERETNFKKQATGDLFRKWTFDDDPPGRAPDGFVGMTSGAGGAASWTVQANSTAPSRPNALRASSQCPAGSCYQLLVSKGLDYEYPDLTVRFRVSEEGAAIGGMVFGARDAGNFYAALVDLTSHMGQVVRMVDGKETVLAQAPVKLKEVEWHLLRVQRNTIISKDFIEMFVDGVLVLTVEDQSLGLGQVGMLTRGDSSLLFDTFHAIPLFSNRPLSAPAAY